MSSSMVTELRQPALEEQRIEICERKGVGHPDYICDAMLNEISIMLSREYLKKFGTIMHHNIDKGLLVAGETRSSFGGGKVLKPMLMVFGDRATFQVGNDKIPVDEITLSTAKRWLKDNLRFVDPNEHVKYQVELKQGAEALRDIFQRKGRFLGANDTSAAVGFAPLTQTERIVLETERFLNGKDFKRSFPESGEDIKVMGLRKDSELSLTVAMAFVDRFVDSERSYFKKKDEIVEALRNFLKPKVSTMNIQIDLNTADSPGRGTAGTYLTVLGTSADGADCGQVGRGNRVNGVIPLNRPAGSEAAAGKNPVSHVGKIYNLLAFRIAGKIHSEISGINEVYVWLLSRIGQPINIPKIVSAQLVLEKGVKLADVDTLVQDMIGDELNNIDKFCEELVAGSISVC